jgi:hypothetical protein
MRTVDPRAAILLRAAVRYDLLRLGEISLDEAFSKNFVDDFVRVMKIGRRQETTPSPAFERVST